MSSLIRWGQSLVGLVEDEADANVAELAAVDDEAGAALAVSSPPFVPSVG